MSVSKDRNCPSHGLASLTSLELQQSYSMHSWGRDTSSLRAQWEQQGMVSHHCSRSTGRKKMIKQENIKSKMFS